MGTLKTLDRFDYSFFRLHHAHAEEMPVGCRLLMEKTFEAIIDAGNVFKVWIIKIVSNSDNVLFYLVKWDFTERQSLWPNNLTTHKSNCKITQ